MMVIGTWVKQVAGMVAVCLPVMVTFDDLVGFVGRVDGPSMQPVLNPVSQRHADLVWIKRWNAYKKPISTGAVVAIKSPTDPGCVLIKRVVAQEGEILQERGREVCHTVPRGHIWIEGENATNSRDSNVFGPISLGLVMGQATHIVWPPHRWGQLEARLTSDQMARKEGHLKEITVH